MENNEQRPTAQEIEVREKTREIIEKVKENSENDYEKNLIYITAGTLVLSLTFIEKIAPLKNAVHIWMVVTSWALLAISLALNLFSHWYSAHKAVAIQKMLNELSKSLTVINQIIDRNNKKIEKLNISTFISMFFGIFFLVSYCSFNAFHMSNLEDKEHEIKPSNSDTIQKDRVISPVSDYNPVPPLPTPPVQVCRLNANCCERSRS